uniref:Uncharacterized protein n=1 Tax=viral metagenome TaxID=1070528 RepID=A0A6C0ERL5_9ZZZZ
MNQFLLNNLSENKLQFKNLFHFDPDSDVSRPYFFLKRELLVTNLRQYKAEKAVGGIRHVIEYKGKWFDYILKREFKTLADWAADAGSTFDDVLYGTNRVHQLNTNVNTDVPIYKGAVYVTLSALLKSLNFPIPPRIDIPTYNPFDNFNDIAHELNIKNLPIQGASCLVQKPDGVIVIGRIIDQKHYELDDIPSKICISVPHTSQYDSKVYERLSDMPEGTTVYFRSDDGNFHSINEL